MRAHDLRRWAINRYGQVDDEPYGGGPGMVLMAPVVVPAVREVLAAGGAPAHVVLPDAARPALRRRRGPRAGRGGAASSSSADGTRASTSASHALLGADEISLGDFVLSGGELAALAIVDAAARHVPGVVGDPGSVTADSFTSGLLDFPVFTRPESFEGLAVPEVLLSGHHAACRHGGDGRQLGSPSPCVPTCYGGAGLRSTPRLAPRSSGSLLTRGSTSIPTITWPESASPPAVLRVYSAVRDTPGV